MPYKTNTPYEFAYKSTPNIYEYGMSYFDFGPIADDWTDSGKITVTIHLNGASNATITISSVNAGTIWSNGAVPYDGTSVSIEIDGVVLGSVAIDFTVGGGVDLWAHSTYGPYFSGADLVSEITLNYVAPTTTTTSTTSLIPTTTTTTSLGPTTTTTTIGPTSTTSTIINVESAPVEWRSQPLFIVNTIFYKKIGGSFVTLEQTDCSDSSQTGGTPFSNAFNFGTLAPGETSQTVILSLNVPNVNAINNIRLALINNGGITFTTSTFGVGTSAEIRSDIRPTSYFQEINVDKVATSSYNIPVANLDYFNSEYVYLNIKLPQNNFLGQGVVRYCWFWDYS